MKKNLADHLQIWGVEDDVTIFTDGSLGMAFDIEPIDASSYAANSINDLADRMVTFLNSLPVGLDVQFVQDISSGNSKVIDHHSDLISSTHSNIAGQLCEARVRRLSALDEVGALPKHTLKLFLRRKLTNKLLETPKLFSRSNELEQIAIRKLAAEIEIFERLGSDLRSTIRSMGATATRLKSHQMLELIYEQWNPTRSISLGSYDPDDVRSSLLFTDVGISAKGFSLGEMQHRVLSLKVLPDRTYAAMAAALRELPFGSRLFLTFNVPDQQKEIEKLQLQRRIAYSMVTGKRTGVTDIESQAKFQDLEALLGEMVAAGEKVFQVSMNVLLRSSDEDELNEMVSRALQNIRELSGADAMEETLAAFDVFSEISLPNARCKERTKYLKTSNLADFLPVFGPWQGHEKPRVLLRSRHGSIVKFDPFSTSLTNANQVISGGSGSGKSYLTNILLMQMMKEDLRAFIIDIGGSYRKTTDNFEGQYITLGVDSGLSLNPFDLGENEVKPTKQKIKFLLGLVELMTKEDNASGLGKLERAEIEASIEKVYLTSQTPCFSELKEILLSHSDESIRRFGRILTPWCKNAAYGEFVDRQTNIELKKPVVCFDLKGMESYPDLQAVVLFIITDFVWREVQKDRYRMKFVVFDECWKLLENDAGSAFIGEVFRTFRKYMASAIAISQNIDDFAKSKIATAILSNSSIKWILKQKGADQTRLQSVLDLNETEIGLVGSLTQERGDFSEAFLMVEDRRIVVAVESTPIEYWLATTDPRDLSKIDEAQKEKPHLTNLQILEILAEQFPRGSVA